MLPCFIEGGKRGRKRAGGTILLVQRRQVCSTMLSTKVRVILEKATKEVVNKHNVKEDKKSLEETEQSVLAALGLDVFEARSSPRGRGRIARSDV